MNIYVSGKKIPHLNCIFSNFSLGDLIRSCAIFALIKYVFNGRNISDRKLEIYQFISLQTFTLYLLHQFIITMMNRVLGINTLSFNPVISVPVIVVVAFVLSLVMAALLNNIYRPIKKLVYRGGER